MSWVIYTTGEGHVAIANGHCSMSVLFITRPETQKLAAWEPSVHWAKHFCPPNWLDLNPVNMPSGVLFSRRSTIIRFSPQLTKWRERLSKHVRNYRMAQSLPIHYFVTFFTVNAIRQMVPPLDSNKLEIRSMERGICPIAVFYFALKRSFFNI